MSKMYTSPMLQRYQWPKTVPPLTPEQRAIADDFMRHWHEILPKRFGVTERFNHGYPLRHLPQSRPFRTIELGAGLGAHLAYEDLSIQEYHCIELRENMASEIRRRFPTVTATIADCQKELPYPDAFFDRAVAVHMLEHLPDLPRAVAELARVLKPGGIASLVIPCDPGLLYGFCRKITAERMFKKRYNQSYSWCIASEHLNNPAEILSTMSHHMKEIERVYFPFVIPSVDTNICIGATFQR